MPVNSASLKTFAPAMRRQLLEAVGRKLDLLLHSQTPDTLSTYARQIAELRGQEAENREQLLERVAYTWFNRLCALRYLDARGWHPFGCKVLMPAAEGETQPDLLKLMRAGSLPEELKAHTNEARLHGLLDGQIPPAIAEADPQGEVYRELVLASCRSYHQQLPELFEGLDDASELLLPDDLLSEGSIAGGFRSAISDADCADVEIIGWLYQFYISEKKDQVIGKVVKSEDIPAATQLFTPNWIVKYMVQNSLGATWLFTYPDSPLKGQMEFYIEPAEQIPEAQAQLAAITPESLDPEALTLIDPACGSGHILVEAYDLLKAIYLERGYRQRDIPELILTRNLYGLDICPRAAQLAAFSLLMKGREDNRRLLELGIQLNVMALQDSTGLNVERLAASLDQSAAGVSRADLRMLVELFAHATTFGSLIQIPPLLADKLPALSRLSHQATQDLFAAKELQQLGVQVRQAEILARRYDAVVANPPYLDTKNMTVGMKRFLASQYACAKKDTFAAFMLRSLELTTSRRSAAALVTPFSWMYLTSYEDFREYLLAKASINSLVELEANAFEPAMVTVSSFVLSSRNSAGYIGSYIRLADFRGARNQAPKMLEALHNPDCGWHYKAVANDFTSINGSPVAYWVPSSAIDAFKNFNRVGELAAAKQGLITGDNDRFLRYWHEVSTSKLDFDCRSGKDAAQSKKTWFPFQKGGIFRRWFGNHHYVVNWSNDGDTIKTFVDSEGKQRSRPQSIGFYFKPAVTWTSVTISTFNCRFSPPGFIYSEPGPLLHSPKSEVLELLMAYLNSSSANYLLKLVAPAMHYNQGHLSGLPIPSLSHSEQAECRVAALELIQLAKSDWDAFERSWDFTTSPLLEFSRDQGPSLESNYALLINKCKADIAQAKLLEERNNFLFINANSLHSELRHEVPIDQVTLTVNPAYRYGGNLTEAEQWERFRRDTMAELLSYATGCIMGRYSLDRPGLILAVSLDNQAEQLAAYEAKVGKPLSEVQFKPDPDGIIPVLDGEWFEDDIVARTREFLAVTFPESSVADNLRFIEDALDKDIRKYFCSEFYKDHLQTYKKRPIYWMVQSPKKGFACLIYLHRYTKDTLNQVLNNYFRPYLQKLEARLAQLGLDQLNDDLPTRERTAARKEAEKITKVLKECQAWEQESLLPLAQQRIELDLDDGVKVNYLKLQDVLAPIPGLAAKEE